MISQGNHQEDKIALVVPSTARRDMSKPRRRREEVQGGGGRVGWARPGRGMCSGRLREGGGTLKDMGTGRNAGLQLRPKKNALTASALVIWTQTSPGVP